MQEITGTSNRVLEVDLTKKIFTVYEVTKEVDGLVELLAKLIADFKL